MIQFGCKGGINSTKMTIDDICLLFFISWLFEFVFLILPIASFHWSYMHVLLFLLHVFQQTSSWNHIHYLSALYSITLYQLCSIIKFAPYESSVLDRTDRLIWQFVWLTPACKVHYSIETYTENNGYVVFKWNTQGSAGKQGGGEGGRPAHPFLQASWTYGYI